MASDNGFVRATLPATFRPRTSVPLVRVGRANDGGYLIDRRNLDHADLLISMGINNDWSFEEHFLSACRIPLIAYDGSVSARDFFIAAYTRMALFEPINARNALKIFLGFRRFFNQSHNTFRQEYVGRDEGHRHVSLDTILSRDIGAGPNNIFFKIDITGSEYHILDTLIACADRIEGLAIEFHDVDRNMRRIEAFIEAFPLALCHVHGNNCGPVLDDGTPVVIECSFTRRTAEAPENVVLPHALDMPCAPGKRDMAIGFADAGGAVLG